MQAITPTQSYTGPIWCAPSSVSGKFYLVGLDCAGLCKCGQQIAGLYHCECKDHTYRARDCKHVRAVVAGAVKPARRKETPAPAPVVLPASCLVCDLYGPSESCRCHQAVAA